MAWLSTGGSSWTSTADKGDAGNVSIHDEGVPPPSSKHYHVLKSRFGHSNFRPTQWKVIQSIIEDKRDNCVIMATGYGKSLTYQYPAVYLNGLSVVVSPLISLMQDQVLSLKMANIEACFLGSAANKKDDSLKKLFNGEIRVLYVTPEFCDGEYGRELLQRLASSVRITLLAIDEAHCVSQWGHDFRTSYRRLGELRKTLPGVPILAVTATATKPVRQDICRSLHLRNPNIVCTSFDRPNLYLCTSTRTGNPFEELSKLMIREGRSLRFPGPTIIYCTTKKITERIAEILSSHQIPCGVYHAGIPLAKRQSVHEDFVRDRVKVVVATVAFGMGIDKPDVRLVIHFGVPQDIESYYQEVGRAGRDGLPALCQVIFRQEDFAIRRFFLKNLSGEYLQHREEMQERMKNYLDARQCRRRLLLSYFDETLPPGELKDNCCDNCTAKLKKGLSQVPSMSILEDDGKYDFTDDGLLFLRAVDAFRKGSNTIILILRGSQNAKLIDRMKSHPVYGQGKHRDESYWKAIGNLLMKEKYIKHETVNFGSGRGGYKSAFPVSFLVPTQQGLTFLRRYNGSTNVEKPQIRIRAEPCNVLMKALEKRQVVTAANNMKTVKAANSSDILPHVDISFELSQETEEERTSKRALYGSLVKLRMELAEQSNCMPYMVASNKALVDMVQIRPTETSFLSRVDGFSEAKMDKFGNSFIEHIRNFSAAHNLGTNVQDDLKNSSSTFNKEKVERLLPIVTDTVRITYSLFLEGKSLEQLAQIRNLDLSTVITHIGEAYKVGLPVDLTRTSATPQILNTVLNVIRSPPINSDISSLSAIKNLCPEYISWATLKLAIAVITKKTREAQRMFDTKETDANMPDAPSTSAVASGSSFKSSLSAVRAQPTLSQFAYQTKPTLGAGWVSKESQSNLPRWLTNPNPSESIYFQVNQANQERANYCAEMKDDPPDFDDDEKHKAMTAALLAAFNEIDSSDDELQNLDIDEAVNAKLNQSVVSSKDFKEEGHSSDEDLSRIDLDDISISEDVSKVSVAESDNKRVLKESDSNAGNPVLCQVKEREEDFGFDPEDFSESQDWGFEPPSPTTDKLPKENKSEVVSFTNVKDKEAIYPAGPGSSEEVVKECFKTDSVEQNEQNTTKRLPDWLTKPTNVKKKMKKSSLFSV